VRKSSRQEAEIAVVGFGLSWQRGDVVTSLWTVRREALARCSRRLDMWNLADRVVKAVSDVTVGTVIVLVHIALADRSRRRLVLPALPHATTRPRYVS
jgi:hypothetical protein